MIMSKKISTEDNFSEMLKNKVRNDPKAGIWIVSFIAGLITFPLMFSASGGSLEIWCQRVSWLGI